MNILFITNNLGQKSGWERYSADLRAALSKKGHIVSVVSEPLLPGPLQFKRLFFLAPWYAFLIWRNQKSFKNIDCIHCLVEPYSFITFFLALGLRKKYFITLHGSYAVKLFKNPLFRFFQKIAYKNAHKIISISNYTKQRVEHFMKLENIVVIPNGVSEKLLVSQARSSISSHTILNVGALKVRKGHMIVLEALKKVKEKIPDIEYIVVGKGDSDYTATLEKFIHDNGLNNNVKILSGISDQELNSLYTKAGLFVLMPQSDEYNFEGFGLVYLEANARAVPALGARKSGAEQAISDGVSGFLIDPTDSAGLAEKIIEMFTHEELYKKLSAGALGWAKAHTWDTIIDRYEALYLS